MSYQSTWECVHIDEIRRCSSDAPSLIEYIGKPISSLFDKTSDWLHLIKGTIQAAVEIVNKKRTMEAAMITQKIVILDEMLSSEKGLIFFSFNVFLLKFVLIHLSINEFIDKSDRSSVLFGFPSLAVIQSIVFFFCLLFRLQQTIC